MDSFEGIFVGPRIGEAIVSKAAKINIATNRQVRKGFWVVVFMYLFKVAMFNLRLSSKVMKVCQCVTFWFFHTTIGFRYSSFVMI